MKVLAKVAPDFVGLFGGENGVKDAALWSLSVVGDNELRTASVVMARIDRRSRTSVPDASKADFETMFNFDTSLGFVATEEEDGYTMVYGNLASAIVTRALHVVMESIWEGEVVVDVSIKPTPTSKTMLNFTSVIPLCFDDPATFGPDLTYAILDVAGGVEDDEELVVEPVNGDTLYAPPVDVSDSVGDVRGAEYVEREEYPAAQVLVDEVVGPDDELHDANIFSATAVHDKFYALAEIVVRGRALGGDVMIIGDHPGSLGRALASKGVDSVGVDPLNHDYIDTGTASSGIRKLVKGSVNVSEDMGHQLDRLLRRERGSDRGFFCYVVDTGLPGEPAEVATARNLGIGRALLAMLREDHGDDDHGIGVFVQLRSAPLAECKGQLFLLPGTNRQGCEVYGRIFLGTERTEVERFRYFNFSVNVPGRIQLCLADCRPVHKIFTHYFTSDPYSEFSVTSDQWYNLIVSRYHVEAAVDRDRGFFDNCCHDSRNALELFVRLGDGVKMDDRSRADARALYESGRVVGVSGVPPGLFDRVHTMRDVVAARYRRLSEFCAQSLNTLPNPLARIMADPRCGALLHRLSELRVAVGHDVELAKYHRVLPYEAMSILASRSFYRALRLYISGVRDVIGKPMHTWELQYLLWSLTHFGTKREKVRYLYVKLEDLFNRVPTGRRPSAISVDDSALRTFTRKLDDVGVRARYLSEDRDLSIALGVHFEGSRKRSASMAGSYLPDRSRRPSSVYSERPPPLLHPQQRPPSARAIPWNG